MSMLNHFFDYKPEVLALDEKALELCQPYFKQMEDIRDYNQLKEKTSPALWPARSAKPFDRKKKPAPRRRRTRAERKAI